MKILILRAQKLHPSFGKQTRGAHGQFLAGFEDNFAGVGVENVEGGLHALHALGLERKAPAVLVPPERDRLIKNRENLLAVHPEGVKDRRRRNFPAPVDAGMDDVLGVEFDIEPGAAIGNDPGREQKLTGRMTFAFVVIEKHPRRTVHLRNDDPFGSVDDERAVHRHQGHVSHIDILLLDVLDRFCAGVGIDIEYDQAQSHFKRRGESHAALAAFVDVIFRRLEFILDKFKQSRARKIGNRENRLKNRLQPFVRTPAFRLVDEEELIIGGFLNFDQVRHFRDFADMPEKFTNTLTAGERLRHIMSHVAPRTS
ncbi:MAG: hypothetical protein USCAAHI_03179 [Beijerinckiaceae bacterium]|nr:MAG: hypothetical protein USCAAHI_03179 [Beijerinckiaceae bacterium]